MGGIDIKTSIYDKKSNKSDTRARTYKRRKNERLCEHAKGKEIICEDCMSNLVYRFVSLQFALLDAAESFDILQELKRRPFTLSPSETNHGGE